MIVFFPLAGRNGDVSDLSNARPGGSDISTIQLALSLQIKGVHPIFLVHNKGPTIGYLISLGLHVLHFPVPYIPKRKPVEKKSRSELEKHIGYVETFISSFDDPIVHTNDANMHRTWGIFREKVNFKHVWHERGIFSHPECAIKWMKSAHTVISISKYVDSLKPKGLKNTVVVNNPVKYFEFSSNAKLDMKEKLKKEIGCTADYKIITMVANSNKRKRWDFFAQVCATRKDPKSIYLVVGVASESFFKEIKKVYTDFGGNGIIINLGYRSDAVEIIAASDVVLMTSIKEPLGRTLIESIYSRTPVVASNDGGHKEIVTKELQEDFLADNKSVSDFVRKLNVILESGEKKELVEHNASELKEKHLPEKHAERIFRIYCNHSC